MITGSQNSLWSTHIVLFRDIAAISQQNPSYVCMAFLCCPQKWSGARLHMKWGRLMESDGTDYNIILVVHHKNWCTCYKQGVANAAGVSREVTKCTRKAANNACQPFQWPSHQIHRISRGTPPWTSDQNWLLGARLLLQHYHCQRGGPSFRGPGTQQWQNGHQQHTRERHCVLSALNSRNRITTDHPLCTHACRRMKEIENIASVK